MDSASTHHACAIVIGSSAILIRGVSGAGKSSLAAVLIDNAAQYGFAHAAWVADDRVALEAINSQLIVSAPQVMQGKYERYGVGVVDMQPISQAVVALVVDIIDQKCVARMPEPYERYTQILGINLPIMRVSSTNSVDVSVLFYCFSAVLNKKWQTLVD